MKRSYLGAVSRESGSFGIVFLDLPGCASAGDTIEHALAMGAEALSGHIASMLDHGDAVPEPTEHDISAVVDWLRDDDDPIAIDWIGLYPVAVEIPDEAGLVTIRMRADLVRQIAAMSEATAARLNSRDFIERAVQHELDAHRKSAA